MCVCVCVCVYIYLLKIFSENICKHTYKYACANVFIYVHSPLSQYNCKCIKPMDLCAASFF